MLSHDSGLQGGEADSRANSSELQINLNKAVVHRFHRLIRIKQKIIEKNKITIRVRYQLSVKASNLCTQGHKNLSEVNL
jgi:hypothetical protein